MLIPALSDVNAAVIPVAPLTALIASFIDVKSFVAVIVAVTVDAAELFPLREMPEILNLQSFSN